MNIKALLKQVPATAYIVSGAIVILWGAWMANSYHQREIGARNAELRLSRQAEDSLKRDIKIARKAREAAEAKAARDSVALLASRQSVRAAAARSDSAVRDAREARARALSVVADSSATLAQLRTEIVSLVSKTAAADSAHAVERARWAADSTTSNARAQSLGEALAAAKEENEKLNDANANLRHQITLVARDRPGVVQRYVVPAVSFGVGVWAGSR